MSETGNPRRFFSAVRGLPSAVWLIGLISLLNDAASDMLYPVLPLYLSSVLMASPRALGLIEGVAEMTSSFLKLFSGVVMDRTRRAKPWILIGYSLAGFGRPLIALATSWMWVLVIRFADRVGKGLRSSPRDALLAGSVTPGNWGLVFGFHRAMDNAGAVIGPLLAALFLGLGFTLRDLFLITLVPAVACLVFSLMIREPTNGDPPETPVPEIRWTLAGFSPAFRHYLITLGLFNLGNSSNMFLLLRAHELGLPQSQIPLAWAAVSAIAMLFCTPLSALSDRLGRVRLIVAGWLVYGLVYLGLGFLSPGSPIALFGLFAFYGIFMAATEGVEKALVADLAPKNLVGTAYGWFHLVTGSMLLPASVVFGWIYETAGALPAFGFSSGCALTATVLLLVWVRIPGKEVQE